jgi:hypothetical protein
VTHEPTFIRWILARWERVAIVLVVSTLIGWTVYGALTHGR